MGVTNGYYIASLQPNCFVIMAREGRCDSHLSNMSMKLVFFNTSLDDQQLSTLKLACKALNIPRQELDNAKLFTDVYRLIEQSCPQNALSLVLQILVRIGVSEALLQSLKDEVQEEIRLEDNLLMDLILTVGSVFRNLSDEQFECLKEIARRIYFIQHHSNKIKSRNHLLEMMLDDSVLTPQHFGFLFAWLEVIECSAQHILLRQYCQRQGIVEPDWGGLVPPLKEQLEGRIVIPTQISSDPTTTGTRPHTLTNSSGSLPTSTNMPTTCSEIGTSSSFTSSGIPSGGSPNTPSQRSQRLSQSLNHPLHHVRHFNAERSPEGDHTITGMTNAVPSTEEGETGAVVVAKKASTIPNMVTSSQARGKGTTDPPSSTQFPMEEVERDAPHYDDNERERLLPEHDKRPVVTYYGQPHVCGTINSSYENENLTVHSNPLQPSRRRRKCIVNWRYATCITCLVIFFILFGTPSFYLFHFYNTPKKTCTVEYIGASTSVIINKNCFDPFSIKSVNVSKGSKTQYDSSIYLVQQKNIQYTQESLGNQSWNYEESSDIRIGANYYAGDDPIYTAGSGVLSYTVIAIADTAIEQCPIQLYLYNDYTAFRSFRGEGIGPVFGYVNSSGCLSVNETLQQHFVNFNLSDSGFYFVGLAIRGGVSLNITISPQVTLFNVSKLIPERCGLNWQHDFCFFEISKSKVPSSHDSMCLLVSSTNGQYQNITLCEDYVSWNVVHIPVVGGLGCLTFAIFLVLVLVICYVICVYCRRRQILC